MTDATCYKPHAFSYGHETPLESLRMALQAYMPALQGLGIRRPRNKYRNVAESYLSLLQEKKEESFKDKNA